MNFLLHRHMALRQGAEPLAGIGSMLPDFWRMAHRRMRPRALEEVRGVSSEVGALLHGVKHHVDADAWFHAREKFTQEERATVEALRQAAPGLNKIGMFGHLVWELCLDGALLLEEGPRDHLERLRRDFRSLELSCLWDASAAACGERLGGDLQVRRDLERIVQGVLDGPWILGYCEGEGLVDRLSGVRRRLGLDVIVEPQRACLARALDERLEAARRELPAIVAEAAVFFDG